MTKKEIKHVLDIASETLQNIKNNHSAKEYCDFLNRKEYYYSGLYVGTTLSGFLAEAVYQKLTEKERQEFDEWRKAHFSRIESQHQLGPRGEYYVYVECFDGKIYAVGEEQGNYAGGHVASMSFGGRNAIANHICSFDKEGADQNERELWEKVKSVPIISEDEYEDLKRQRQQWPEDFSYWLWFK